MKKIFTYISIITAAFLFAANSAEARTYPYGGITYISGYASCGSPIYTKKVIVNHDRYGKPVYKYYSIPFVSKHKNYSRNTYNRHSSYRGKNYYSSHHNRSNYNRGHHNRGSRVTYSYRR